MRKQTRRTVLKSVGAAYASMTLPALPLTRQTTSVKTIRLGVIADLHGGLAADADARLDLFLETMSSRNCDALIQLGDFAFPNAKHQQYADKFNAAHEKTIHVIGNHEFDFGLSRTDCLKSWGMKSAYYHTDVSDLRVIVLDGNEKGSPKHQGGYPSFIGNQQMRWLDDQLSSSRKPALILSHQPLAGPSAIDNAVEIQNLLANHKDKILVCLNGHSHVDSLLQVKGVDYLHVNSASYYWVGGKTRMAYYENPLFTTVDIDVANRTVNVQAANSRWKNQTPSDIGYFDRDEAPPETIVVPAIRGRHIDRRSNSTTVQMSFCHPSSDDTQADKTTPSTTSLKIMTWNIWGRLNQAPQYTIGGQTARSRTIDILRESEADIIAMIETYGSANEIAKALGFHHYTPAHDANLCIFSRHPLSDFGPVKGLSSFSFIAATVNLPNQRKIRLYDIWLTSSGRHIVEIKNSDVSDREFCDGDDVRFDHVQKLLQHDSFIADVKNADKVPVVVAGDFNCVSHLDHHVGTRHSFLNHGRVLPIKVSKSMHKAGFMDTFRACNPDVVESTLGHTWTTVGMDYVYKKDVGFVPIKENPQPEYRNPYTRIDYIYSVGSRLLPIRSSVISHHRSQQERSFPEFPSDHAAVLTEFQLV